MDPNPSRPNWLAPLTVGTHACFFYTTSEEFFSIAAPYLAEGFGSLKERCLWILPPKLSFLKAKHDMQQYLSFDLDPLLKLRRFMMVPWEKWYGAEIAIQDLLRRGRHILKETLHDGFEGLRILGHSPDKSSAYWKDFLLYEETVGRSVRPKPFISLCGYSLIDCPAAAIPPIASNHSHCLIHHGSEWEWLTNKIPLHSHTFHYRHPR